MGFEKAKIITEDKKEIAVLFNPAEYSLQDSANYTDKSVPGQAGPITQFVSGAATTLSLSLFFDTYGTGRNSTKSKLVKQVEPTDVSLLTREISKLTKIDGAKHRPPICTFSWGTLNFEGVIKSVNQTFTMFMENGMPVRARLEVNFQSVLDLEAKQRESPFESPDRTKRRVIREGMQLWHLAWEEYDDPEMWRVIAQANGLMNPLRISPGQVLRLPAL